MLRSVGLQNQPKLGCVENGSLGSDKFLIMNYSWDWTIKKILIFFFKACNFKDEITETFSVYKFSLSLRKDFFLFF